MEKQQFYALTVALCLAGALLVSYPRPSLEVVAAEIDPMVLSLAVPEVDQGPEFVFGTSSDAVLFSDAEVELIEVAVDSYVSTTIPPPVSNPTPNPTTPPTTSPPAPPTTASPELRASYEAEFFDRINSYRSSNGLATLTRDGSLDARARDWARRQAEAGSLKHSNLASLLPPWLAAGENLGVGGSVQSVFSSLLNSGSHRSIIVGNYTHIGIGVWVDGNGAIWTTHVFARA